MLLFMSSMLLTLMLLQLILLQLLVLLRLCCYCKSAVNILYSKVCRKNKRAVAVAQWWIEPAV